MSMSFQSRVIRSIFVVLAAVVLLVFPVSAQAQTPDIGMKAPDFTLSTASGTPVQLSKLTEKGLVVLVFLRGYPGYNDPFCQQQVRDFLISWQPFATRNTQLVFVYPGPAKDIAEHAKKFLVDQDQLPENFHLVLDPDYTLTNLYDLRWKAEQETAYPATFLINSKGNIVYRKIGRTYSERTTAFGMLRAIVSVKDH